MTCYSATWLSRYESIGVDSTGIIYDEVVILGPGRQVRNHKCKECRLTEGGFTETLDTKEMPAGSGRNQKDLGSVNEVDEMPHAPRKHTELTRKTERYNTMGMAQNSIANRVCDSVKGG